MRFVSFVVKVRRPLGRPCRKRLHHKGTKPQRRTKNEKLPFKSLRKTSSLLRPNFAAVKCDVLMVGASAAGFMAALSAAKEGYDVIVADRDPAAEVHAANTLFEGMARHSGLKVESCYIKNELEGMSIISPAGRSATIPTRGYFLDRGLFDEHYRNLAHDRGIMILPGVAKEILPAREGGRTVRMAEGCSAGEIAAQVVVDASGVKSGLARAAGLFPMHHPEDIAWAVEADIEHPGIGEEAFFQYWIGSMAPGWKATFSPAGGDRATLGVFVRGHGRDVEPFFQAFLKIFKAAKAEQYRGIDDLRVLSLRRGGDPICVLPGEVVADSLMVTGGAAGQSGLAYGMRAGAICGEAAARAVAAEDVSKKGLSWYEQKWRRELYWQYRMGRASLLTLAGMKDSEIDRLVGGLSGKRLISSGPFLSKAAFAGAAVARYRPRTLFELAANMMRG